MLIAFSLGNIFAHSLLIRENFFLFAACIALLYARSQRCAEHVIEQQSVNQRSDTLQAWCLKRHHAKQWIFLLSLVLVAFVMREVYLSFSKFPYLYGSKCYVATNLKTGDWSSGFFILDVPDDVSGVVLNIRESQPPLAGAPISFAIDARYPSESEQQKTLRYELGLVNPQSIFVSLDAFGNTRPKQLTFTVSRCFTPKNQGLNVDPRRLGVVVENVLWKRN
jgi:hypothetical protein